MSSRNNNNRLDCDNVNYDYNYNAGYDYGNEYSDDGYAYDLEANYYANVNKRKKSKIASIVICVFMANVAVFILYCVRDMSTIKAGAEALGNYASSIVPTTEPVDITEEDVPSALEPVEPTATPEPVMLSTLTEYYARNNDLIGWLKIEGTPIDNPVMFTPDNETEYLEKDFDGNAFKAGTLFIDDKSVIDGDNSNIIIYGHNMKNQTMFGSLKKYADKSYYTEHRYINFNTLYQEGTYEVMVAFYAKVLKVNDTSFKYYQYTGANTEDEFNIFRDNVFDMALYDTGISKESCVFSNNDQFITLSTCSYHTENGRFVVIARRIQ